jgi:hypothetical protein
MSMKNSSDIIGNRTFRLVGQCLNKLRPRLPPKGHLEGTNYFAVEKMKIAEEELATVFIFTIGAIHIWNYH